MKVLVVVDMQNDFIDGSLGTPEAVAIVPSVIDNYLETSEGRNLPVKHCIKGTAGHDIPSDVLRSHEVIFEKLTFGSVELASYLEGVDFDSIELIGLCTDICVISNALMIKAHFPEREVMVDSSCCAGVTPDTHTAALTTMKMCQIKVI